ncbi:hypothetical protein GO730_28460 [Spirosoma sp. HMF3257]|uniref:Uncharacterized protein n=1 Tax=Spirosoma telluris TaxID=2183553 RepID=A0A327NP04_9BACT|nr:hypothetical protein [Spirosoma telluris]RAI77131.1 hypothetical protein HMF3257_28400 [Spirosoma telluris]
MTSAQGSHRLPPTKGLPLVFEQGVAWPQQVGACQQADEQAPGGEELRFAPSGQHNWVRHRDEVRQLG